MEQRKDGIYINGANTNEATTPKLFLPTNSLNYYAYTYRYMYTCTMYMYNNNY